MYEDAGSGVPARGQASAALTIRHFPVQAAFAAGVTVDCGRRVAPGKHGLRSWFRFRRGPDLERHGCAAASPAILRVECLIGKRPRIAVPPPVCWRESAQRRVGELIDYVPRAACLH